MVMHDGPAFEEVLIGPRHDSGQISFLGELRFYRLQCSQGRKFLRPHFAAPGRTQPFSR